METSALANARDYYGRVLRSSADLRTDACATPETPAPHVRRALANVHPDVKARYFGCGLIAPEGLRGARVLDLGCGSGQDAYVLAQLAGADGEVVGVDATPEQLEAARRHVGWHSERFGFANVSFVEGDIEELEGLGFAPASFDVIVSNCVVNLVEDKARVFAAARTLLKPGGEFYFSDVYSDRRAPRALRDDPVLHGECLAGALYWNDFLRLAREAGFDDARLVSDRPLSISDPSIAAAVAPIRFFSATYRLFNIEALESACEDYGQAVRYKGGLLGAESVFALDKHHQIEAGRIFPVCGNTYRILSESRFAPRFEFMGDRSRHFGLFKGCGADLPFSEGAGAVAAACC